MLARARRKDLTAAAGTRGRIAIGQIPSLHYSVAFLTVSPGAFASILLPKQLSRGMKRPNVIIRREPQTRFIEDVFGDHGFWVAYKRLAVVDDGLFDA